MAKQNIKDLMDDIIKDTDKRYSKDEDCYEKFDGDAYREKLSMFVLKDIIDAMMAHDTKDLDGMIDDSIMKHIHDDYKGTCYGYLCNARDKCKSPLLAQIIQEIEGKTAEVAMECELTKNHPVVESADVKEMLKGVDDYDSFIEKLATEVSQKVVNDVAGLLTDGGAKAPSFSDLDDKIELQTTDINDKNDETEAGAAEETPSDEEGKDESTDVNININADEDKDKDENKDQNATEVKTEEDASAAAPASPSENVGVTDSGAETAAGTSDIPTTESVILTMCGNIVFEAALQGIQMETEEGIERAVVQYCLAQMDYMFKQPSTVYAKYYHN